MNQRVIYQNEEGGVSVLIPAPECGLSIEEIARKDVPAGIPYKIINDTDLPEDRTFRDAWEVDITDPDGFGIGHDAWFAEQAAIKAEADAAAEAERLAQQQAQEEVANDNDQPE